MESLLGIPEKGQSCSESPMWSMNVFFPLLEGFKGLVFIGFVG